MLDGFGAFGERPSRRSSRLSGTSDIDENLEVRLVDGIIYSFQEQTTEDQVMLDGFGTFGERPSQRSSRLSGASDIDENLEVCLVDGIIYSF